MVETPICPKCGSKETQFDDWTFADHGGDYVELNVEGHCEECGTSLTWVEYYTFDSSDNVQLVEDEDEDD